MAIRKRDTKRTLTTKKSTPRQLPRGRHDVDERREQLVRLGTDLFSRYAYDEVPIDEVARMAGISKGLLYHYFPTKRVFYTAVVQRAANDLVASMTKAGGAAALPLDRLKSGVDAYLDFVVRHGAAYAALLHGGVGADPEIARIVDSTREGLTAQLLEGLMPPGDPHAVPAPLLRFALRGWVGFVEAASLDWSARREVSADQLRDLFVRMLVQAVEATVV